MSALCLAVFAASALADDLPENEVDYELGQGLRFSLDNGRHVFRIGGFVQPSWQPTIADGEVEHVLAPKRTQFGIDGSVEDQRIPFGILTDFSLSQPLLEAWGGYRFGSALTVSVGQRPNPANLREMLVNEGYLSFPERSAASQAFSETGRELGVFADMELAIGQARVRPSIAVTSGDGRNSFGVDSRDVDRGGLKWGGRVDLLPLGDFAQGNRAMITDVAHEESPRVVLGGAVSFNDGASAPNGEGHALFALYDAEGNFQQPDYTKINVDLLFKWRGASVLTEFVSASASGLQGSFTDPVGGNPLFTSQISEFLVLGSAINVQAGYCFDFGLGVDLRYTQLQDEFEENVGSVLRDTSVAGAAVTALVQDHDLKFQLAGSRVKQVDADAVIVGELLAHLRF